MSGIIRCVISGGTGIDWRLMSNQSERVQYGWSTNMTDIVVNDDDVSARGWGGKMVRY